MEMNFLTRDQLVQEIYEWKGTPYCHQASLKKIGADCVGFLRGVWRNCVGEEPELDFSYSHDWAESSGQERLLENLTHYFNQKSYNTCAPGDILLFQLKSHLPSQHLAFYISDNLLIHAHRYSCICEIPFTTSWKKKLSFVFSFPNLIENKVTF